MEKFKIIISTILSTLGAIWLLIEVIDYFFGEAIDGYKQNFWWLLLLVVLLACLIRLNPKKRFSFTVDGRDISVKLVIGDIFKEKGPIIVGSNTIFETNPSIISPTSIQGLFSSNYFDDVKGLNAQISSEQPILPVEYGTTVTVRGNGRVGYFCAISEINDAGVARSNMENLLSSLGGLWGYLSENAEKSILNVPVLGSGFSRITEPREEIIREIVLSFLVAIRDSSFCEGIRVVIHPDDVKKYKIDIDKITKFLEHHCQYQAKIPNSLNIGSPE